ncbi:YcxB-like protein [Desulfonispora thiosulfatigenes DSM 11270]|uniref:YcxB-like protein n=1 Tax=Desulfonispora thiosulfatigenes DSM 11270 TaxID=656914 RepID=A0A1W1VFA8_DESTI|nr:YcxB family protein [Desulfonispora thiosulfatigenes]SMB92077.1 YcxB-like protein [Desulfonispora thiosulfatigenes DSM 11270]
MQIEYEITNDDILDFKMHTAENTKSIQQYLYFSRYVVACIFLATPFIINGFRGDSLNKLLPLFTIPFFLWIIFYPVYHKNKYKRFFTKNMEKGKDYKELIGKHSVTVGPKKVIDINTKGESKFKWNEVVKVDKNKQNAFIYTSETKAIIIPARTFENQNSFNEFIKTIKKYFNEAKHK